MILTKSIPVGMVVCRWKCNPVRHFHQSIVQIRHILLADKKIRARFGKPVFLSILLKKRDIILKSNTLRVKTWLSLDLHSFFEDVIHIHSTYRSFQNTQNTENTKRWSCRVDEVTKSKLSHHEKLKDNHLYFDPQNNRKISKFKVHKYIDDKLEELSERESEKRITFERSSQA